MSTKGMSVVAARPLVDELCAEHARLFIVRDFDKAGFSIAGTLTGDTRRYAFRNTVDVVDLGIRLADVEAYNLVAEPVSYGKTGYESVVANLRENGATEDEIGFLAQGGELRWQQVSGQRVELNAFTSDKFLEWLEAKLEEAGAAKVVPRDEVLHRAYRRALMRHTVNAKIDEITASAREEADHSHIPADLAARVRDLLDDDPEMSWDAAVAVIAGDDEPNEEES
jgi:hypothetical protein